MKKYELIFLGYTWEEYFYVISNKSGVIITYRGRLDAEGGVELTEILNVDGADVLGDVYESENLITIRKNLDSNYRIFYSYADVEKEGRLEVVEALNRYLLPQKSKYPVEQNAPHIKITCKGSCALFPQKLLIK